MLTQVRHDKLDDKVPRHLRMTIFSNIKRRNMKCLSLFTSHISSPKIYAWMVDQELNHEKYYRLSFETAAFCHIQSDFLLSWVYEKMSCFILNASFAVSISNKSAQYVCCQHHHIIFFRDFSSIRMIHNYCDICRENILYNSLWVWVLVGTLPILLSNVGKQ